MRRTEAAEMRFLTAAAIKQVTRVAEELRIFCVNTKIQEC
jgi:hypothetical protein